MEKFTRFTAVAAPFPRANVDTDQIIPKQFLLAVDRKGFGKHLFHEQRYLDEAETQENPDFVLNKTPYRRAGILVAQENFGSGSSREHAPWALLDFGLRAVIAPSFADIFRNNALGNGLLTVVLPKEDVAEILAGLEAHPGEEISIDLEAMTVEADGKIYAFTLDPFRRRMLLEGLDAIGLTMQDADVIRAYESHRPRWRTMPANDDAARADLPLKA